MKRGKNGNLEETRRELEFKEEGQEYAQVIKMLGDGRVELKCFDGVSRQGLIRGSMRKRVWINIGDIVLIGLRDFEEGKADIIHKYTTDEARMLQSFDQLPARAKINQTAFDLESDADSTDEIDNMLVFKEDLKLRRG